MGDGLIESPALRGEQNYRFPRGVSLLARGDAKCLDALEQRLGLKYHAFAAAEGAVVHGLVAVFGEFAQVLNADLDQSRLTCAAYDSVVERSLEESGKDGDNIDFHGRSFPGLCLGLRDLCSGDPASCCGPEWSSCLSSPGFCSPGKRPSS